jgi:hypothetical protein
MTKKIRIENADSSNYDVEISIWDKASADPLSTKVDTVVLRNPADMFETYITETRYVVVFEKKKDEVKE